jgi:hypothetical protein
VKITDLSDFLSWLQVSVLSIVQWLQKYKASYLVVVLIGARIKWRIYRSLASRRQERTRRTTKPEVRWPRQVIASRPTRGSAPRLLRDPENRLKSSVTYEKQL